MSDSLLSVVIPVYNAERYVKDAVTSILHQAYKNMELIIIDDVSTDSSLQIIESIKDDRIILVKNGVNRGQIYTRNLGLKMAKGEYIGMFDADDIAYHDKFKLQIDFLKKNEDYGMIGSWAKFIDEDGKRLPGSWKLRAKPDMIPSIMLFKNYFLQSAVIYRKDCISKYLFKEGFDVAEDYKIWLEIIADFKTWNLQEYLVDYRVHKNSITKSQPSKQIQTERVIFKRQLAKLGIDVSENELKLHLLIKDARPIKTISTLKQIEKWLLKIEDRNEDELIYDRKMLSRVIFNRWLKVCKKASGLRFKMIYTLFTSRIFYMFVKSFW